MLFVPFLSPSAEAWGEAAFVGVRLFPCVEKEQKLSGRKIFVLRVDSSYIK